MSEEVCWIGRVNRCVVERGMRIWVAPTLSCEGKELVLVFLPLQVVLSWLL